MKGWLQGSTRGRSAEHENGLESAGGVVVDLLAVVWAVSASGCFACLLDGGQEQGDEDADDRDDHQHLDEGEGAAEPVSPAPEVVGFGIHRELSEVELSCD